MYKPLVYEAEAVKALSTQYLHITVGVAHCRICYLFPASGSTKQTVTRALGAGGYVQNKQDRISKIIEIISHLFFLNLVSQRLTN